MTFDLIYDIAFTAVVSDTTSASADELAERIGAAVSDETGFAVRDVASDAARDVMLRGVQEPERIADAVAGAVTLSRV